MKILLTTLNLTNGGAQRVISVLANELAKMNEDVSLLVFGKDKDEYPINENVKVRYICNSFDEYVKMSFFKRLSIIRKYLKQGKFDVFCGFLGAGYFTYFASLGLKIKRVASARIDPKFIFSQKGIHAKFDKFWFSKADGIVLQANGQIERVPQKLRKRCAVIGNPISQKAFTIPPKNTYESCKKFVMSGRLNKQKNYQMAIESFEIVKQKHKDVSLDIYGIGEEKEELLQIIKDKNLQDSVRLCGWSNDMMAEEVNYDAYLLTSNFEGLPNSLMEAMCLGLPCISTDCQTGPKDLIEDGENGFLVRTGESDGLAQKIIELIEFDPSEREKIGKNARKSMRENYNNQEIANKWLDYFKSLKEKR